MPTQLTNASINALRDFNHDYTRSWDFGDNWNNQGTDFETFINKYLFPKLNETRLVMKDLGNRFDWLAREEEFIGQFSEEYVILDSVPINMNLSKNAELMLLRNYPQMATKLYGNGQVKKLKFTLNNNDNRLNWAKLADGVRFALAVYKKQISNINYAEELEIKGTLIDYATTQVNGASKRTVTSLDDLANKAFTALLNIQNNSSKYNEANKASGGTIGRYTTQTLLNDVAILTTDEIKTHLLGTQIANTFQIAGLDITQHILSFDDLGGVYKLTDDVTITEQATINYFRTFGDYQIEIGDIIPKDSVITFDVMELDEFNGNAIEVKPEHELFAYIFDVSKLNYKRNTKDMLKEPFNNPEFDEVTHWLHYYSFKAMSPFYNSIVLTGE